MRLPLPLSFSLPLPTPPAAGADFATLTSGARRVLCVELAGLGDLVHSLPSLWALRRVYPDAELHALVRPGGDELLRLAPWIDRVHVQRRGDGVAAGMASVRDWRRLRFDVAIDLIGSEANGLAAWASGARWRLARRPGVERRRFAWRLATHRLEQPFRTTPMFEQRWRCLQQAGLCVEAAPRFVVEGPPMLPAATGIGPFVHLSPFARGTAKEMETESLVRLVRRVHDLRPDLGWVVSCAPSARERAALPALLAALPVVPKAVHAGTLEVPALCAWIAAAAVHLSADSGSMHLAGLVGTPSLSWFASPASMRQWTPSGERHASVCVAGGRLDDDGAARLAESVARLASGSGRSRRAA